MKQLHQTIIPILIFIACFLLAVGAKRNQYAAQASWKGVVEKKVEEVIAASQKPTHQDILGLRNLILLIAKSNGLPVTVAVQEQTINVALDTTQAAKEEALNNDTGLYQFLYTVSALPYRMKFTRFELGVNAPTGLDFAIQVEGI